MAIVFKKSKPAKKSTGFAVIFVLAFIALLITIVGDVVYQTQIVAKHTMSIQDQRQAQGTALTGVSIARVLLKSHIMTMKILETNSNFLTVAGITLPTTLYSSLNGVPIGKDTLTDNPTLTSLIEPPVLDALRKIPGSFVLNVNSENCKFNLNLLQIGRNHSTEATQALRNLFATESSKKVLSIYGLNYNTLVDNLVEYFRKIKRPLISLQEIRMIEGFQYDDIYNMYSPYFTVWPGVVKEADSKPLLNANCAPVELLAGLFRATPDAAINPILWKNFEEYRGDDKTFKKSAEVINWFDTNAKTWIDESSDLRKMIMNLLGYENSVYSIESTGTVNKTKQKLTVVLRIENNTQSPSSQQFINEYNQWSR